MMKLNAKSILVSLWIILTPVRACHENLSQQVTSQWGLHIEDLASVNTSTPEIASFRIAIKNVRAFTGSTVTALTTVFIDDGLISRPLDDVDQTIDGQGGILMPGLIDSHCHPTSLEDLRELSSYGITTAMGMACFSYELCHSFKNQRGLTSFFTAGFPVQGKWSVHAFLFWTPFAKTLNEPHQVDEFVEHVFSNGSDYLKITAEPRGPTLRAQKKLVEVAHARKKMTMTHAADIQAYRDAIESGTDGIQHAPSDGLVSADMIKSILEQGQFVTPTIRFGKIITGLKGKISGLGWVLGKGDDKTAVWKSNARAMWEAGVPILAGTDSTKEVSFVSIPFGLTLHHELEELVSIGMSPSEALRAATSRAAELQRLMDRGRIAEGLRADLILLLPDADPLLNITHARKIARVWNGGVEFSPVAPFV